MSQSPPSFERFARDAATRSGHRLRCEQVGAFRDALHAARFRLDNGLRVVLMPDTRAPVFSYQTWFAVGSRDEDPERTGLAHLFEHLMFKGTETHPTGTFDREMERRGSQTNAATWVDWTYYTEALAARGDNLQAVVDFEVDRMTRLVLDEDTFRKELEVVKNERRMAVEDSVTGALAERLYSLAYQSHPYRWPTIGFMSHLEASTLDDLRAFYRKFYAPNNATVEVGGDVDPTETLTSVARAYGPLEPQPAPARNHPPEPRQTEARHDTIHRPVLAPQVLFGYHSPPQSHPDFPAMEIAADILTSGESARLYRRLVIERELATGTDGSVSPFADPGLFELLVHARPGVEPDVVIEVVQQELDALPSGIEPRELNKARNDVELAVLEGLKDAEGCAEMLGHYETIQGVFSLAFGIAERVQAVDAATVCRVAAEVFRAENRCVVSAVQPDAPSHSDGVACLPS